MRLETGKKQIPYSTVVDTVKNGALTSILLAEALDIKRPHAQCLLSKVFRNGVIIWKGEYLPRDPNKPGPLTRLYEVAS